MRLAPSHPTISYRYSELFLLLLQKQKKSLLVILQRTTIPSKLLNDPLVLSRRGSRGAFPPTIEAYDWGTGKDYISFWIYR